MKVEPDSVSETALAARRLRRRKLTMLAQSVYVAVGCMAVSPAINDEFHYVGWLERTTISLKLLGGMTLR